MQRAAPARSACPRAQRAAYGIASLSQKSRDLPYKWMFSLAAQSALTPNKKTLLLESCTLSYVNNVKSLGEVNNAFNITFGLAITVGDIWEL